MKKGEHVYIDVAEIPEEMTVALIRGVAEREGYVYVKQSSSQISRAMMQVRGETEYKNELGWGMAKMKEIDCYVAIRGSYNVTEASDIPAEKMQLANKVLRPLLDERVNNTRWVISRWPTPSMAQQAQTSTEAFEDFFFDVCTLDYGAMVKPMEHLQKMMEATDKVHIKGEGTDLTFSIKDIPVIPCYGTHNIPDGEVFTAPVKDSVNGVISYNAPTLYQGIAFDNIKLTFKDGKIIEATANDTEALNKILDSDEGARYIGEFAIGVNPKILEPMRDILFDEKIGGSFHFTPGQAYEDADNGNRSQVHWDMVCIQRPDYGGGTIEFDGEVIRKDGQFLDPKLASLNPKS